MFPLFSPIIIVPKLGTTKLYGERTFLHQLHQYKDSRAVFEVQTCLPLNPWAQEGSQIGEGIHGSYQAETYSRTGLPIHSIPYSTVHGLFECASLFEESEGELWGKSGIRVVEKSPITHTHTHQFPLLLLGQTCSRFFSHVKLITSNM